ncbi:Toprim domain protein, partial [gut metagenome]
MEDDSPEDTAVPDGGCRTLRLVPGAREHGTRENRSGEGVSVRANGNGTGKPDGYTEEAAAPFDCPEPKPYRTTEKPFT